MPCKAVPCVRCPTGAIHCCAMCTVPYLCHTLLCHLYGALLVTSIAVPAVRCTVGAMHCCAMCTVPYWCHILLCHLYGALLVPYTAVPYVRCTVGAIHCCAICTVHCWCHTLLCHFPPSAVNCLVSQSAPFCCLPFCSTQFLISSTHPNPRPGTLPHNVLLSTKWRPVSLRWFIHRRL